MKRGLMLLGAALCFCFIGISLAFAQAQVNKDGTMPAESDVGNIAGNAQQSGKAGQEDSYVQMYRMKYLDQKINALSQDFFAKKISYEQAKSQLQPLYKEKLNDFLNKGIIEQIARLEAKLQELEKLKHSSHDNFVTEGVDKDKAALKERLEVLKKTKKSPGDYINDEIDRLLGRTAKR